MPPAGPVPRWPETGRHAAVASRRRRLRVAVLGALVLAVVVLAVRCGPGGSSSAVTGRGTPTTVAPAVPGCPVGTWTVSAEQEFAQLGLGELAGGSIRVTGGAIRAVFAADHTYAFRYDGVRLSVGGTGSATVDGPVTGTWDLAGDLLTTTVRESRILVAVAAAGVTVAPSRALDDALKAGVPQAARVSCTAGTLVTTVGSGAAAGRQVTFRAG